jgi:hypothetical protein
MFLRPPSALLLIRPYTGQRVIPVDNTRKYGHLGVDTISFFRAYISQITRVLDASAVVDKMGNW